MPTSTRTAPPSTSWSQASKREAVALFCRQCRCRRGRHAAQTIWPDERRCATHSRDVGFDRALAARKVSSPKRSRSFVRASATPAPSLWRSLGPAAPCVSRAGRHRTMPPCASWRRKWRSSAALIATPMSMASWSDIAPVALIGVSRRTASSAGGTLSAEPGAASHQGPAASLARRTSFPGPWQYGRSR